MDIKADKKCVSDDEVTQLVVQTEVDCSIDKRSGYKHIATYIKDSNRNHLYLLIGVIVVLLMTQLPVLVSSFGASHSMSATLYVNCSQSDNYLHHNAPIVMTDNHNAPFAMRSSNTTNGEKYVIYIKGQGRFGNIMFQVASGLGMAHENNRTLVIEPDMDASLGSVFKAGHYYSIGKPPERTPVEAEKIGSFGDERNRYFSLQNRNVTIFGYFQSFIYFDNISSKIREMYTIHDNLLKVAQKVKEEIRNKFKRPNTTFVGIHARRGDYTLQTLYDNGSRLPKTSYIINAMTYFRRKYQDVHFIVCSDDPKWCEKEVGSLPNVTFVHGKPEQDFVQLVECDHMIITYGTFGWWAAWLGGGEVVYFDKPYGGKLEFRNEQMRKRHFLPHWVPMGD